MSEPGAEEAAAALRDLTLACSLGPLRGVRLEAAHAATAASAASQILAHPEPGVLLADTGAQQWLPDLVDLAGRLLWSRQHDATRAVLAVVREIGRISTAEDSPPWRELSTGYLALTDLTQHGPDQPTTAEPALAASASALCRAADHYLARADHRRAALVASAALWVLFHQELHDARPTSPLVSDSEKWLRPLTQSRVGALLTAARRAHPPADNPTADNPAADNPAADGGLSAGADGSGASAGVGRRTPEHDASGSPGTRSSLLVLSGAYPRFAEPIIAALETSPGLAVSTLALSGVDKPFKRMAVEPWLVELRMAAARGEPVSYEPVEGALAGVDTVLADWADAGAMLASLLTPPGTALTVRVHSVDALRCWLHLIDWSAVDQLVCVGPHIQDLIDAQLGERLAHVRDTVLPNLVQLARFDHPRPADTDHTLAMVGWARAVKDPLWTVELLARLRRHDPRWRLLLVGHPFPDALPPSGAAYARRFAERAAEDDVRSAIDYVPFTDQLAPVLARAGWVVSSSVRESWGVGPMEAVAAGAVPVIRNWPLFARWGGPRRLYPDEWVVDSLERAEERILSITAAGAREAVAQEASKLLSGQFNPHETAAGYRLALTTIGTPAQGPDV